MCRSNYICYDSKSQYLAGGPIVTICLEQKEENNVFAVDCTGTVVYEKVKQSTAHSVTYIQKQEHHPWNLLRAPQKRLTSSDEARNLEIEQKHHKLYKVSGSPNLEHG